MSYFDNRLPGGLRAAPHPFAKSRPFWTTFLLVLALSAPLLADPSSRSLLLGGPASSHYQPKDLAAHLPLGAALRVQVRPALPAVACAPRAPVCAHASTQALADRGAQLMAQAYERLSIAVDLPLPHGDGDAGGGPELDLYLVSDASPLVVTADLRTLQADSTSGHCQLGALALSAQAATRCWVELSALRLDAAETPALRAGLGEYESWLALGPSAAAADLIGFAQANPQLGLAGRARTPESAASALWWAHLDASLSKWEPGKLPLATYALSRRDESLKHKWPPNESIQWRNAPDALDVVRSFFDLNREREAEHWLQWAVDRAFMGSRDDGAHAAAVPWTQDEGRIRFDWTLKTSTLPRYVMSERAIEPLGAMYTWVELDDAPTQLGLRVEWEPPVRFHWAVVGVDEKGRETTRWELAYTEQEQRLERTLMNFANAVGLIIVGVNLGGVSLQTPFEPDFQPWEPHRASVYLARLE